MFKVFLTFMLIGLSIKAYAATEISTAGTNLGIGTSSVANALTISSTLAVGSGFTNTTAPSNGVIIQGSVGIGTATPQAALDVNAGGNNYFGANVGIGSTAPQALLDVNGTGNNLLSGNVGIGTDTTPDATLEVTALSGNSPFIISSTASTTGDFLTMSANGNLGIGTFNPNQNFVVKGSIATQWGAPIPVLSSCGGGSPAIKGTDKSFQITVGTTATGCTATFGGSYQDASCLLTNQSMSITSALSYTVSNTAIVISQAVGLSGDLLNVQCDFKN